MSEDRIVGVETGGCPHAAIREDSSLSMDALEGLMRRCGYGPDYLFVEGGDDLAGGDYPAPARLARAIHQPPGRCQSRRPTRILGLSPRPGLC